MAKKHGMSHTKIYKIWKGIIDRCCNPNGKYYDRYMGRGIVMCESWRNSFENFYKDMGDSPPNCSIDRIDNNKGYCKENCRWATRIEQQRNRRTVIKLTFNNQTKTLPEWAELIGISNTTLWKRLNAGWDINRTLTSPLRKDARHE